MGLRESVWVYACVRMCMHMSGFVRSFASKRSWFSAVTKMLPIKSKHKVITIIQMQEKFKSHVMLIIGCLVHICSV